MGQQTIRQLARRAAQEKAATKRAERLGRERRQTVLVARALEALAKRDAAINAAEERVGQVLREWTDGEGATLTEMVEWCGGRLTLREASRLRRIADELAGIDEVAQS